MHKHTTMTTERASLCALGEDLRRHCFFALLREHVQIRQKTVRYRMQSSWSSRPLSGGAGVGKAVVGRGGARPPAPTPRSRASASSLEGPAGPRPDGGALVRPQTGRCRPGARPRAQGAWDRRQEKQAASDDGDML